MRGSCNVSQLPLFFLDLAHNLGLVPTPNGGPQFLAALSQSPDDVQMIDDPEADRQHDPVKCQCVTDNSDQDTNHGGNLFNKVHFGPDFHKYLLLILAYP